jgi:pyruvate,orthophosphate dikinase
VSTRLHYSFSDAAAIDADERSSVLGGKGAALVPMTALGLPVPPGFVLTTDACKRVSAHGWFSELEPLDRSHVPDALTGSHVVVVGHPRVELSLRVLDAGEHLAGEELAAHRLVPALDLAGRGRRPRGRGRP